MTLCTLYPAACTSAYGVPSRVYRVGRVYGQSVTPRRSHSHTILIREKLTIAELLLITKRLQIRKF
eukprot:Pgem_evm1s6055